MPKSISSSNASKALLSLQPSSKNNTKHQELVSIILGRNSSWIDRNGLTNVTIRLLALQSHDPSTINGAMLAMFAKRLLAAEDKVGGPYTYKKEDKVILNTLIAHLFLGLGKPLPNLNGYLGYIDLANQSDDSHKKIKVDFVANTIKRELKLLDSPLNDEALKVWRSVLTFDLHKEISMLTKHFYMSLKTKPKIPESFFIDVGVANFYAWMAYSIYDDLIDGEENVFYLPLANILQRKSLYRYLRISNENFVQQFYDKVDISNFYELNNLRFSVDRDTITIDKIPDYEDGEFLAKRAIGHILGPSLIIQDYLNPNDTQKKLLKKALEYFLIARQLNDDAHDWVEDIKSGHASYVVSFLLKKADIRAGTHSMELIITRLRKYFWQSGLKEISDLTINYIENSLLLFEKTGLFNISGTFFKQILVPIKQTAEKSVITLDDQKLFLKKYKQL